MDVAEIVEWPAHGTPDVKKINNFKSGCSYSGMIGADEKQ